MLSKILGKKVNLSWLVRFSRFYVIRQPLAKSQQQPTLSFSHVVSNRSYR